MGERGEEIGEKRKGRKEEEGIENEDIIWEKEESGERN
jgi:hypothetical protein